jgi:transaldolase
MHYFVTGSAGFIGSNLVDRLLGEGHVIRTLAQTGVKLNVTALMTLDQVRDVSAALAGGPPACVSVFAGRVADTGRDPVPLMGAAVELIRPYPNLEISSAGGRTIAR